MRRIFTSVLVVLALFDWIYCNQTTIPVEIEQLENWNEINDEICKKDHSKEIQTEVEKCHQLDPFFKLNSLTSKCDKLRPLPGSSYYDEQKAYCKYQECYEKEVTTDEYKKASDEFKNMKEEEKSKKSKDRYECMRKVLGLKI